MRRIATVVVLWLLAVPAYAERVIVELRQPAAKTRISLGHVRREFHAAFNGVAMDVDAAELKTLAAMPFVKAVYPDQRVRTLEHAQTGVSVPHALAFPHADGVVVAVLDTGIDYTHPALAGRVAGGYDFVDDDDDPMDDNGHGTHVAGIVTSVAPGVTLLAYKVIAANGWGWSSDVIAALDRAIDDHADVANLSFGGVGNPDDPQSMAVDNAIAAGIIVCVSAGNGGDFYAITSPGTSRNAITVGAAGANGEPALFSSRGPSPVLATIKPDLLAPGVDIVSTSPGGGVATMSGTSMAAPYVAGGCAIIRSLHRSWTPRQIKSVLTMTAIAPRAEVMAAGAGLVDIAAALTAPLIASQSHLSFGLDANDGPWARAESITVTSIASTAKLYAVSISGESARVTPPLLTIAPGESCTIFVDVAAGHADETPSSSYAIGGLVTLASSGSTLHFPWAYVRASHATMTIDNATGSFFWITPAARQPVAIGPNRAEAFVPRGSYELAAFARKDDRLSVVMSSCVIAGEIRLDIECARATHAITLAGTDERGMPLASLPHDGGTRTYFSRFRIGNFDFIDCVPVMFVSDLPAGLTVTAAEIYADFASHRIIALQYAPVTSSATLTNGELRHQPLTLAFGSDARRRLVVASTNFNAAESTISGSSWSGDVYVNDQQSELSVALMAGEPGMPWDVVTPPLLVRDAHFAGSFYAAEDGEAMTYGAGPLFALPSVTASASRVSTHVDLYGFAGDSRPRATAAAECTLYDRDSHVLARRLGGDGDDLALPEAEQYRVEFIAKDEAMNATLEAKFDSRLRDATPPALTSLLITNGVGRIASRLIAGGSGALTFTATGIAADATRAWLRTSGTAEWRRLPLVQMNEEQFRGDLPCGPDTPVRAIDLRIELTDASGNQTTFTLVPALEVSAPRRRATR